MSQPIEPTTIPQRPVISRFVSHLLVMPHWHKGVLSVAMLVGIAGVAGHISRFFSPPLSPPVSPLPSHANSSAVATPGSKIVADDSTTTSANDAVYQTWLARNAPWLTRVGLGCLAGFIVGWLFRAFIKMMSMLTLAGAALFAGLSYFHVMNVDLTEAKQKYDTSIAWVSDQAGKLKDATLAHVPASSSSAFGAFLGFRRRKL